MKDTIFPTTGSPANSVLAALRRSAKVLAKEQHLIGVADAVQSVRLNLRRFSPTTLSPTRSALRPERKSERNDVAGDAAHAADHRAFADPD